MRGIIIHSLKHAVVAAVILAVIGYLLATAAGVWVDSLASDRSRAIPGKSTTSIADSGLTTRMPLVMAAWGFVIVIAFESVRAGLRHSKAAKPSNPPATPTSFDAPTTDLTATPVPRGCPVPVEADNTAS